MPAINVDTDFMPSNITAWPISLIARFMPYKGELMVFKIADDSPMSVAINLARSEISPFSSAQIRCTSVRILGIEGIENPSATWSITSWVIEIIYSDNSY